MTDTSQPPIPIEENVEIEAVDESIGRDETESAEQQASDLAEGAEVISTIDSPEGEALIEKLKSDD